MDANQTPRAMHKDKNFIAISIPQDHWDEIFNEKPTEGSTGQSTTILVPNIPKPQISLSEPLNVSKDTIQKLEKIMRTQYQRGPIKNN